MRIAHWLVKQICNVPPPDHALDREYYRTQRDKDRADLAWYDWRGLRRVRFKMWFESKFME
jgi:hypothetical protein